MKIIEPHKNPARAVVTQEDIDRVLQSAYKMTSLCRQRHGLYEFGRAIAHTQVEKADPLSFFVTHEGFVFVNPEIISHDYMPVLKSEGCLSFPHNKEKQVQRYKKIKVQYQKILEGGSELKTLTRTVSGIVAEVFQHEIDHLKGKYVYDMSEYLSRPEKSKEE